MDFKLLGEKLDEIEMLGAEILCLMETTADSCEINNLTTQEMPLRLACQKQETMLDQLRNINVDLYATK